MRRPGPGWDTGRGNVWNETQQGSADMNKEKRSSPGERELKTKMPTRTKSGPETTMGSWAPVREKPLERGRERMAEEPEGCGVQHTAERASTSSARKRRCNATARAKARRWSPEEMAQPAMANCGKSGEGRHEWGARTVSTHEGTARFQAGKSGYLERKMPRQKRRKWRPLAEPPPATTPRCRRTSTHPNRKAPPRMAGEGKKRKICFPVPAKGDRENKARGKGTESGTELAAGSATGRNGKKTRRAVRRVPPGRGEGPTGKRAGG